MVVKPECIVLEVPPRWEDSRACRHLSPRELPDCRVELSNKNVAATQEIEICSDGEAHLARVDAEIFSPMLDPLPRQGDRWQGGVSCGDACDYVTTMCGRAHVTAMQETIQPQAVSSGFKLSLHTVTQTPT